MPSNSILLPHDMHFEPNKIRSFAMTRRPAVRRMPMFNKAAAEHGTAWKFQMATTRQRRGLLEDCHHVADSQAPKPQKNPISRHQCGVSHAILEVSYHGQ